MITSQGLEILLSDIKHCFADYMATGNIEELVACRYRLNKVIRQKNKSNRNSHAAWDKDRHFGQLARSVDLRDSGK